MVRAAAGGQAVLMPGAALCLALGTGFWFALPGEPGPGAYALAGLAAMTGLAIVLRGRAALRGAALALLLIATGFLATGYRAHSLAAPVLGFRYYGPVEGRVVAIDRSWSDRMRLVLEDITLEDVRPERRPGRVRIVLHGAAETAEVQGLTGRRLRLTAHLMPPQGPVAPGGFDFRRHAWFAGIGAVGYAREAPVLLDAPPPGWRSLPGIRAAGIRMDLARGIRRILPGQAGALAAALATGDRSGLNQSSTGAMRAANLSHMLAISGLHMGLVAGFCLALTRLVLVLFPPIGLRRAARKISALAALSAATLYLILAGPGVATQRAWIMAAVMLLAILLDRRAVSLQSLGLAAVILLLLRPEALVGPGFQMSFAATAALILCWRRGERLGRALPKPLKPVLGLLISSAVAGAATAPVAAAHFNRVPELGLLANLATVPVLGLLVMPAAVLAALAAPFGLAALPLAAMGAGCGWILWVAERIAAVEGAVMTVPAPPGWVLPLLGLGAVLAALASLAGWRRAALCAGLLPAVALVGWLKAEPVPVLISGDGALIGAMTAQGRALSRARGAGFTAALWLEDDGDPVDQAAAAARPAFTGATEARRLDLPGLVVQQLIGQRGLALLPGLCRAGVLVVLTTDPPTEPAGECDLWHRRRLWQSGALALWPAPEGATGGTLRIVTTAERAGRRLWSR